MRAPGLLALAAAALAVVAGCTLDRRALGTSSIDGGGADVGAHDGATPLDASDAALDAGTDDTGALDAGPRDAGSIDTGPLDTGPSDVGVDARVCPMFGPEACNLTDDDCDGRVDETACGGCTAFERGGHVYLSCPPVTGWVAWEGACRRTAPGYELAHVDDDAENAALAAQLGGADHLIGANDFETNGAYVAWDRAAAPFVGTFTDPMAPRALESVVVLRPDGTWDDDAPDASHRLLCEGVVGVRPCTTTRPETACDGVDDDCDGTPDDGIDCGHNCVARTFWDHVYWVCTDMGNYDADKVFCNGAGATPPIVRDPFENAWLGAQDTGDAWLGLAQTNSSSEPAGNWSWADGVPLAWNAWGTGEPNDCCHGYGNEEQCAILDDPGGGWYDGACDVAFRLGCERAWSWP